MRYLALAVDYDGTVASHGELADSARLAIERLRISGRRTVLVTGRRVEDLLQACPAIALFDLVVAENGGVVYDPSRREDIVLGVPVPDGVVDRLRERGVDPIEVGKVLVATRDPHGAVVFEVIRELGLELQVIVNRSVIMVLPAGINKATGLKFALHKLGLSQHEAVGIGDAENDHSFLRYCECGVAVANAVASLKDSVEFVTRSANGDGVAELIDELIANDLGRMEGKIERHLVLLGERNDGTEVRIPPYGRNVLIAGPSGSGKSTLTAGLVERLIEKGYQVCIIDPEGDYGTLRAVMSARKSAARTERERGSFHSRGACGQSERQPAWFAARGSPALFLAADSGAACATRANRPSPLDCLGRGPPHAASDMGTRVLDCAA